MGVLLSMYWQALKAVVKTIINTKRSQVSAIVPVDRELINTVILLRL